MSFSEDMYRLETNQSIFELHGLLSYMAGLCKLRVFTGGYFQIDWDFLLTFFLFALTTSFIVSCTIHFFITSCPQGKWNVQSTPKPPHRKTLPKGQFPINIISTSTSPNNNLVFQFKLCSKNINAKEAAVQWEFWIHIRLTDWG